MTKCLRNKPLASQKAAALNGLSKSFRLISQSLLLGLGAYLALNQEISPGMMIAGSLLLGRALAPIDMLVGTWKGFSLATAQYNRLKDLLEKIPLQSDRMSLPAPEGNFSVEQATVVPPGSRIPVVRGVSFEYRLVKCLALLGQARQANQRSRGRCLGIWPTYAGKVRLDGADISSWDRIELGPMLVTCHKISNCLTEPSLKILPDFKDYCLQDDVDRRSSTSRCA